MCVPMYMYAHVCAGAHGEHRHWSPRDEVSWHYEAPVWDQVTESGSSAETVKALNQRATSIYHTKTKILKIFILLLCIWVLFAWLPMQPCLKECLVPKPEGSTGWMSWKQSYRQL